MPIESHFTHVKIAPARVTSVRPADWSIDVVPMYGGLPINVQVLSPYLHHAEGEGIYCMPEVGAVCYLCYPSEGRLAVPVVLGFSTLSDEKGNFSAGRPLLNPGDIMLRGRDGNQVVLRRGGVVQIGSTAISQRLYLPIRNWIRDICENYSLTTFAGEFSWEAQRPENSPDGDAPTSARLLVKESAGDPQHIATLTVGSHGQGVDDTVVLTVFDSGAEGAEQKIKLTLQKSGNVTWEIEQDYTVTVKGKGVFSVDGDVTWSVGGAVQQDVEGAFGVKATGAATLESSDVVTVKGSSAELKGGSNGVYVSDSSVSLGSSSATEPGVLGLKLATILAKIGGILDTVSGGSTGISSDVPQILSQKVKLE